MRFSLHPKIQPLDESDLTNSEVDRVIRYLRSDLLDDWFPDPVGWADLLDADYFRSLITDRTRFLRRWSYRPEPRAERDVPKQNGTLRYSLEQTLIDRFVYQFLVTKLAPDLDPLLVPSVLNHRVAPRQSNGKPAKKFFKSGVAQWSVFKELVAADVGPRFVVEADIQTFYEAISARVIADAVHSAIADASVSQTRRKTLLRYEHLLLHYIPNWAYLRTHGLPQNRDASSFLANLVMRQVDNAMIERGYDYFRYMDDIRIRCDSHSSARQALARLCICLRELGLSLNSAKTQIHAPGSEWHKEQEKPGDPRMGDISNMMGSKSATLVFESLRYLSELTADVIESKDVGSRTFRFCVNRIVKIYLCPDIDYTLPKADELRRLAIESLKEHGFASDKLCQLLFAMRPTLDEIVEIEDILLDQNEFLHDWQRFQIARLLLAIDASEIETGISSRILREARRVLHGESSAFPLDSAILILGARGDHQDKQRIARDFGSKCDKPYLQRAAFVAIHNMDYDREIAPHVVGVNAHLFGTLRRYSSKFKGTYFLPPDPVPLSEIAHSVDSYVG